MRAQGSLEYLIIITTAIAVLAVVASFVSGYFSTQSDQFYYASCSNAAALCRDTLIVSPGDQCPMCNNACNFTNGTEIFTTASFCCRQGKPEEIYHQSSGCSPTDCSITGCPSPQSCYLPTKKCGTLTFIDRDIKTEPSPVKTVAIGNADNMGVNDVVVGLDGSVSTNQIRMYNFSGLTWTETLISPPQTLTVFDLEVGNGDNLRANDVWFGSSANDLAYYEYVTGSPPGWGYSSIMGLGANVYAIVIGNVDNIGSDNEVVTGTYNNIQALQVHKLNLMSGSWDHYTVKTYSSPTTINSISIGNIVNPPLANEIVAAAKDSAGNTIRSYEFGGTGLWTERILATVPQEITKLAVGDADNDGRREIVYGMNGVNELNMLDFIPISNLWVTVKIASGLPNTVTSVAIGDPNTDGYNEIVAGLSASSREIRMYKNETGTWTDFIAGSGGTNAYDLALGDADGVGGENDIVVAYQSPQNKVKIYSSSWTFP